MRELGSAQEGFVRARTAIFGDYNVWIDFLGRSSAVCRDQSQGRKSK
jgi:hypothetical protein